MTTKKPFTLIMRDQRTGLVGWHHVVGPTFYAALTRWEKKTAEEFPLGVGLVGIFEGHVTPMRWNV